MNLVIRLPDDLRERLLCFPALQVLVKSLREQLEKENEELEEEQWKDLKLHLIAHKNNIEVLNLASFSAFYHELEDEDLKSVFTVHRAVKNMKIDLVDTFITFSKSFIDASIGKSLKAKNRIGFSISKNILFLNKKVTLLKGRHHSEQYFELARPILEKMPEELSRGYSRDLEPLTGDWRENPYSIVNLKANDDGEVEGSWEEFFSLIENEKFYLVCDGLPLERQKEALTRFIKKQSKKNTYDVFELENLIEFGKLAAYAQTFISYDSGLVHLAAYCGAHIHYLQKEGLDSTGPIHFLGDIRYFNLNEPFYRENNEIALHKIFDELIGFLDKKAKDREE